MRSTSLLLLLPDDPLRQQTLKQRERLQRLAQIVARRREKARFGDGRQFRLPLGGGQRVGRAPRSVTSSKVMTTPSVFSSLVR